jgi:recombination protein RecA
MYNEGISKEGDILDLAVKHELVGKSGAWYEYEGSKIGQGKEAAKQYLKDNPKTAKILEEKIRKESFTK